MDLLKTALIFAVVTSGFGTESKAAPFNQATVRRIIDGRDVFIDRQPASVDQSAERGQEVSTGRSRAELLFDRRALGFLGTNSLIRLGEDCFRLNRGQVLVNGPQNSCLGTKVLGIRGTTYVLSIREDSNYELAVLSGQAFVGNANETNDIKELQDSADILSLYPTINPELGVGTSAWGSNASGKVLGEAAGVVLADASFFLPLRQVNGSNLLYSYTTANSNLDAIWGGSSELGYKWFNPENQSINSLLVGYDGWNDGDCFHSQIVIGGLWQQDRWKLGASGGIPVDGCANNLGYVIGELGVPVADVGEQSITVSLAPYLIHGIGNSYGGGRIGLNVPISNQLTLSAYGQYDNLLNTVIGGQISYRFSPYGALINDPNANQQSPSPPALQSQRINQINRNNSTLASRNLSTNLLMVETPSIVQPLNNRDTRSGHSEDTVYLQAGDIATFDSDGNLLSRQQMSKQQFSEVIVETMRGQNLLPESNIIKLTYQRLYGIPNRGLLAILGSDWRFSARTPYPRLRGANNLVVPNSKISQKKEQSRENNKDEQTPEREKEDINNNQKDNERTNEANPNEVNPNEDNRISTPEDEPDSTTPSNQGDARIPNNTGTSTTPSNPNRIGATTLPENPPGRQIATPPIIEGQRSIPLPQ